MTSHPDEGHGPRAMLARFSSASRFNPDIVLSELLPHVSRSDWIQIPSHLTGSDEPMWSFVRTFLPHELEGQAVVVTDHDWDSVSEAPQLSANQLPDFFADHPSDDGNIAFIGDVFILLEEVAIVVHHSGLLCVLTLPDE